MSQTSYFTDEKIKTEFSSLIQEVISMDGLSNLTVVKILQYVCAANHHILHLELTAGICQLHLNKPGGIQESRENMSPFICISLYGGNYGAQKERKHFQI